MMKTKLSKRVMSIFLCLALLMTQIPLSALAAPATVASSAIVGTVADPGTADTWETMMGTETDGNRYAGRVWVDKSVYTNGQTAVLNSKGDSGSSFQVSLADDEAFQVIFSALGSSMTTTTSTSSVGPMDVVLVLDNSASMAQSSGSVTRLQQTVEAANSLLAKLLTIKNVRVAVVSYGKDSQTILELGSYANGVVLAADTYSQSMGGRPGPGGSSGGGILTAYDNDGTALGGSSDGYQTGTNLQSGIDTGMKILNSASEVSGRVPVMVVLTDGRADTAVNTSWYDTASGTYRQPSSNDVTAGVALSTLLNAAYMKASVEDHYSKAVAVYGVGVDLNDGDEAVAIINPGHATYGFTNANPNSDIRNAYTYYTQWVDGSDVSFTHNRITWTFDQLPAASAVTSADVIENIHYVDTYYEVSAADLEGVFDQIYDELSSGVFNPISSSTTVDGATGVDNTPLIYVDFIGQYMEVKQIQAVTLFGTSYSVQKNEDGTYTVASGTGTNPTTGEDWSTSEDILISVTEQADGTQKLEIRINQQILPILMEKVVSKTVGGVTSATITEFTYSPLRVYYTIGLDADILLPTGEIDVSKLQGYEYIDDVAGTVSFYSNRFGVMNPADDQGIVTTGDAHVGFQPSAANRYYYHQTNQTIFSAVSATDGSAIDWNADEYGVKWEEGKYDLTYLTYEDYKALSDDDEVYTYVTYYRPTEDQTDAVDAAEQVTYLVYTNWGYLKESVAFYDRNAGVFVNYDEASGYVTAEEGYAAAADQVAAMMTAYLAANPNADILAVLGVGSLRTSRLHNMQKSKPANNTESAVLRYDPDYTYATAGEHNENDVVVWLGNNGRLTVAIDTGIALTKNVTEAIGNADDTYAVTVTVPVGVLATPVVMDADGNDITAAISTYYNNVLTVNLKAGQTVYITGIPAGTECAIGEIIPEDADYYVAAKTDKVTIPTISQVLAETDPMAQFVSASVTNAPNEYGNLFITKEITSDHTIPESILSKTFEITVHVGTALAGETFTVIDSAHAEPYEKTVDEYGNMVFTIQARQTIEILALPEGTQATVTETAPESIFAVSYRTRNHTGADADTDNAVVITADANATAVIINHYTPNSTTVELDIAGTKNFTIEGSHNGGTFLFKVQKWNGTAWEDMEGMTAEAAYTANESGIKAFLIENVLAGIEYTEVGSYAYQVLEVVGAVDNVTYDRTLYTFTVTVTDNGGQLVATVTDVNNTAITDGSYEVTFNNTFHTAPVSIDIVKDVVNNSGDTTVSKAGFAFQAVQTDAEWNPLTGEAASTLTVYSDAAGNARLAATYTTAGTYYYVLTEVSQDAPGWSYSAAEYRVTVTVTEENGNLTATMTIAAKEGSTVEGESASVADTANSGTVSFINTYDPEDVTIDLDGKVLKELTGKTLKAGDFTFYVCEDGTVSEVLAGTKEPVLVGTNDLNGNVEFVNFAGELLFSQVGKYEFDIIELIPDGAVYDAVSGKYVLNGMYYDPTIYDLVVEVTNDPATGKLVAVCYFEDAVGDTVTFYNRYTATPTEYTIGGWKDLDGRAVRAGEFTFELYEGDTWLETVTVNADGSFTFSTITYTEAGTYTYTIKEVGGDVAGVTYNGVDHPITLTVTVTDNNGVLTATANIANVDIRFENTYTASPAQVSFEGTKTLVGRALEDYTFTFRLYRTDYTFDITGDAAELIATATNVDGMFDLATERYSATGTYFYAIVEDATVDPIADVVYDSTQHNFTVQVTDVGDGQLKAVVTNMATGVSGQAAASVTVDAPFTNATFDEVTEKEVYHAGNTTTQIDGQKVNPGDILTYFITYTNYTGEDVVVDIIDTIPEYTTYVEGSASHGGTYAGTHVNWILNVAKGESVTVSFDVRVDEVDAIVDNTAVVRDGVNTYYTNEVINHTVEDNAKKDVFAATDAAVSIDGSKVYEGDELLYQITFTNTSGTAVDLTITDVIPAYTTYVEGSADNGGVFDNGTITWSIAGVPAWGTVTVTFRVTVNTGVGAAIIENEATVADGTNTYTTNVVTNYTVDDEVQKEVYAATDDSVNIDGNKVYEGDALTYAITYTNTASEMANVTIIDNIPAYTTYVDGSADNGGLYENGTITWTLEVEPGATVTVTFQVTVNADIGAQEITNEAQVLEGKNSYSSNEVVNYTVEDEVEKEVYTPDRAGVNIDGNKVYEGDELIYVITYTNTASEKATVTIIDTIPAYTTYVDGSASDGGVYENGTITWTLEVEAGTTATVTFKVTVNTGIGAQEITNEAQILEGKNSYTTNETFNYTVEDEVEKEVYAATDDSVNIDGNKVYEGDELIYTITYTNTAKEKAVVTIVDWIPAFTTYVSGSASSGGVYENGTITWTLDVEPGETVSVTFKVTVNADIGGQQITNEAEIREGKNTYTTNETFNYTVEDEVEKDVYQEGNPEISIDGSKVYEGDELVYTITYTNTATEKAVVTIIDTIPAYTTYVDGSANHGGVYENGIITWTLEVEPGEAVTVSFKVTVNTGIGAQEITNEAQILEGRNTYTTNETFNYTVEDEVIKEVSKVEDPTANIDGKKVYAGDELIYTITYTNSAREKAVVTITDWIPEYTTYVEGSADNGGVYENGTITWTLEVEPGATVTVSFKVTVNADIGGQQITNEAEIREGKNTYTTNETFVYTVEDEVNKDVSKAEDPTVSIDGNKVYEGDELIYTITYENTANEKATVTIIDTIPAYTTYVDGSASNGGVYENGTITWTLEVEPGATVTVTFKVIVNTGIGAQEITNEAQILEGENTYTTNETFNYTVEDEVQKDSYLVGDTEVSIDGNKVYEGDEIVYTITYTNTAREKAAVTIIDWIPEYTTYVEGSADNGGVFENGTITWTLEVEPGATVTVSFKVTVNADIGGQQITNEAEIREGKNTYTTNETFNYTVEDEVGKDVFQAEDPTVSIDGEFVSYGDTLVYVITYQNTALEKVTVTITDRIPEYTTYVEGSADNGGVFENGMITWTLEVEPGATITVAFQVTVEKVASATITNEATVVEGRNTYTTNQVSNPTTYTDIPNTGDSSNLWMWFALMFVSGSTLLGLANGEKKRRRPAI